MSSGSFYIKCMIQDTELYAALAITGTILFVAGAHWGTYLLGRSVASEKKLEEAQSPDTTRLAVADVHVLARNILCVCS